MSRISQIGKAIADDLEQARAQSVASAAAASGTRSMSPAGRATSASRDVSRSGTPAVSEQLPDSSALDSSVIFDADEAQNDEDQDDQVSRSATPATGQQALPQPSQQQSRSQPSQQAYQSRSATPTTSLLDQNLPPEVKSKLRKLAKYEARYPGMIFSLLLPSR